MYDIPVMIGSGVVTLGVIGTTLALLNSAGSSTNRRSSSYDDPYYYGQRRQDSLVASSNAEYARNVKAFEERLFGGAARNALRGLDNMRRGSRQMRNRLRYTARAMGHNAVEGVRSVARSTGHMAKR